MKILIGPDSLKGSVSASRFCQIAEELITSHWPNDQVISVPLADGGEGTVEALVTGAGGAFMSTEVTGPLGHKINSKYGILKDQKTAVIEMAEASGLSLVPKAKHNPMVTTTFGTGELILDAITKKCTRIIIGIGGSATNDGGLGMLQALGYKCLDSDNNDVPLGGRGLLRLRKIIAPEDNPLEKVSIQVACDVSNPLYGENGAAYIYAAQKGADQKMIEELDQGLRNYAKIIKDFLNVDISHVEGAGAAGGLGAGLSVLKAQLLPGFEIIRQNLQLDMLLREVDLVITAEGQMNRQSLNGKLPIELSKLALKYNIPTIAFVGERSIPLDDVKKFGIVGIFPIVNGPISLKKSIKDAETLITDSLQQVMSLIHTLKS